MHTIFKNFIVDFPSYFHNNTVYKKMIDHTLQYLRPYLGAQQIDNNRYLAEVFSMNHIKAEILLTKEIF
jgi:hypothetical protein